MAHFNEIIKNVVNSYVAAVTILFSFARDIVLPLIPYAYYIFTASLLLFLIAVLVRKPRHARMNLLVLAVLSLVTWGGHWAYQENAEAFGQVTAVPSPHHFSSGQ